MGVVNWKRRKRVICFGCDMLIWVVRLVLGELWTYVLQVHGCCRGSMPPLEIDLVYFSDK